MHLGPFSVCSSAKNLIAQPKQAFQVLVSNRMKKVRWMKAIYLFPLWNRFSIPSVCLLVVQPLTYVFHVLVHRFYHSSTNLYDLLFQWAYSPTRKSVSYPETPVTGRCHFCSEVTIMTFSWVFDPLVTDLERKRGTFFLAPSLMVLENIPRFDLSDICHKCMTYVAYTIRCISYSDIHAVYMTLDPDCTISSPLFYISQYFVQSLTKLDVRYPFISSSLSCPFFL